MFGVSHRPRGTIFAEDDPRWKCCCSSFHVKRGALLIGYTELALLVVGSVCLLGVLVYGATSTRHDVYVPAFGEPDDPVYHVTSRDANFKTAIASYGVAMGIQLLIVSTMLYGAHTEKRKWLLPHMIASSIGVCVSMLRLISSFGGAYHHNRGVSSDVSVARHQTLVSATATLLGLWIHIWFFMVVYRLYQYIGERDQRYFNGGVVISTGGRPNDTAATMVRRYEASGMIATTDAGGCAFGDVPPAYSAAVAMPPADCPPPVYPGMPPPGEPEKKNAGDQQKIQ